MLRRVGLLLVVVISLAILGSSLFWILADAFNLPVGLGVEHGQELRHSHGLFTIMLFSLSGYILARYLSRCATWIENRTITILAIDLISDGVPSQRTWPSVPKLFYILNAALWAICALRFGFSIKTVFALVFVEILLILAYIDARTLLLPDLLTIPLMLIGLTVNSVGTFTDPLHAVYGAIAGYLVLWLILQTTRLRTGRDCVGYGDLKLLSALGAWFGVESIPWILMLSCILGLGVWFHQRASRSQELPFGPCLAIAGVVALFLMPEHLWRAVFWSYLI